ncbi:MAG: WD40 repeat domain-containing protein [Ruminococcus sp.]|nr:WD40 repeat domain-containing protein [Ruminococcus sp.]
MTIKPNVLHYYIDLLRMDDATRTPEQSETCVTALHNIISTMRLSRHDKICGEDLSRLDFGNIPFNGIHWSLNGECPSCFDRCKLNEWSFVGGHTEYVSAATWSPNGKYILTGSADGSAIIWDVKSGLIRVRLQGHTSRILSVKFSFDGERCLTGTKDGTIIIWDTKTGHTLQTIEVKGYINDAVFNSDSDNCLILLENGTVRIYNSWTGNSLDSFTLHGCHDSGKSYIRVSSNDKYCLVGSSWGGNIVELWNLKERKYIGNIEVPESTPSFNCLAFSKDEKRCIIGFNNGTIKVWDIAKEDYVQEIHLKGFVSGRDYIGYSIDGKHCISAVCSNGTSIVYDTETGNHICELKEKMYSTSVFSVYNNYFITSSDHNAIKIWNMKTGKCINTLGYDVSAIEKIMFSRKGQFILIVLYSGIVYVYSNEVKKFMYSSSDIMAVLDLDRIAFSEDEKKMLVCNGSYAKIWDLSTGTCLQVLKGHDYTVCSGAFSEDNCYCITGSGDHTAKIWSVNDGKCIQTLVGHSDWVYSVAIYKKHNICLTGSADKTVKIWDIKTGKCLNTLYGHSSWIRSAVFSPNGECCITSDEYSAKIWSVKTGKCLGSIPTDSESTICFSPNGKEFFLIFGEYTEVYDLKTQKLLKGFRTANTSYKSDVASSTQTYWSFPYCLSKNQYKCRIYKHDYYELSDSKKLVNLGNLYNVYGLHINSCSFHRIIANETTHKILFQYNGDIAKPEP